MKNKIFSFLLSLALIISIVPTVALADYGYIEFYNQGSNLKVTSFNKETSLYAKIDFIAPSDGDAVVLIAKYLADGSCQVEKEDIKNLTPNAKSEYTTSAFSVVGISRVKVFVWDDMWTIVPIVKNCGVIERVSAPGGGASGGGSGSGGGSSSSDGETTSDVTLNADNVQAFVPAGTKVTGDNKSLKLTVTELENSASGIKAGENEVILPLDIHVDGIAEDNTVPVIVTVEEVLAPDLIRVTLNFTTLKTAQP